MVAFGIATQLSKIETEIKRLAEKIKYKKKFLKLYLILILLIVNLKKRFQPFKRFKSLTFSFHFKIN